MKNEPTRLKSVLLVDDEPQIRQMLREVIEEQQYRVIEAANGRAAFRLSQVEKIDLLITDLMMPDQEGIETIRQFREIYPDLKIVAISGGEPVYLRAAGKLGADAMLRKPLDLDVFSNLLNEMLGR